METRTLSNREYEFDPLNRTILFHNGWVQRNIILVANVTENNVTMYNFGCPGVNGTFDDDTHKLTMEYNTTSMSRLDNLVIIVEDLDKNLTTTEANSHLLREILTELKLLKMHYEHITDEKFSDEDIED